MEAQRKVRLVGPLEAQKEAHWGRLFVVRDLIEKVGRTVILREDLSVVWNGSPEALSVVQNGSLEGRVEGLHLSF